MSQADNVTETKTETKKFNLYQGWWCKCGEDAGEGLNCKECGADKPTEDLTFDNLVAELAPQPEPKPEPEEEPIRVKKIEYKGKKYLKEKNGIRVFDYNKFVHEGERVLVGNWDDNLNVIVAIPNENGHSKEEEGECETCGNEGTCYRSQISNDLLCPSCFDEEYEEENFLRCEKCDYCDEKNADGAWEEVLTCDIDDKVYCKECMPK
jgi:hypothetical protein